MTKKPERLIRTEPGTRTEAFATGDWLLLASIALIWGSSFLLIAVGLRDLPPALLALVRLVFGAATLSLVPKRKVTIDPSDRVRMAILSVIWVGFPMLAFPYAEQWIPSSLAGMVNGSMPLFAAVFASVLLKRLPGRSQAIGLAVGFTGVVAISRPAVSAGPDMALGVGLALLATIMYGLSVNIAVPLQHRYGAAAVLFRVQLLAVIVLAPFGLAQLPRAHFGVVSFAAVAVLGVFGTGVAFIAMTVLAGRVGAARASVAIYFLPVVAIVLGVAVLGETVDPVGLIGTGLVLVGAYLTSRREPTVEASTTDAGATE